MSSASGSKPKTVCPSCGASFVTPWTNCPICGAGIPAVAGGGDGAPTLPEKSALDFDDFPLPDQGPELTPAQPMARNPSASDTFSNADGPMPAAEIPSSFADLREPLAEPADEGSTPPRFNVGGLPDFDFSQSPLFPETAPPEKAGPQPVPKKAGPPPIPARPVLQPAVSQPAAETKPPDPPRPATDEERLPPSDAPKKPLLRAEIAEPPQNNGGMLIVIAMTLLTGVAAAAAGIYFGRDLLKPPPAPPQVAVAPGSTAQPTGTGLQPQATAPPVQQVAVVPPVPQSHPANVSADDAKMIKELAGNDDSALMAIHYFKKQGPAGVPPLVEVLRDKNEVARQRAALALREMAVDAVPAIPDLLDGVESSSMVTRRNCQQALIAIGPPSVVPMNDRLKSTGSDETKLLLIESLIYLGPDAAPAVEGIAKCLTSKELREPAFRALEKFPEAAVPYAITALESKDLEDRLLAMRLLAKAGPSAAPAIPSLVVQLEGSIQKCRYSAAVTLARVGPEAVPAVLESLQRASKKEVQDQVATTLAWLGDPAIDGLTAALNSERPEVRWYACIALGKMGTKAGRAIEPLEAALESATKSEDEDTIFYTTNALRKIRGN